MLLQLGDQLIRSESIAVLELVKNSYDANANIATIRMRNLTDKAFGRIEIEDDGDGMSVETIKNVWMYPGTENKNKFAKNWKENSTKRLPIGGKGIGRFGVHKLGYVIELFSKTADTKEVYMKIDWRDFQQDTLLEKIQVGITEHSTPEYFTDGKKGTLIRVSQLKSNWTRGSVRELYRALNSLSSPFKSIDSFETVFDIDEYSWLKGLVSFEDVKDHALYYADVVVEGAQITKLDYEFRPWDSMNQLKPRKTWQENVRLVEHVRDEQTGKNVQKTLDLSKHKIGKVNIKLLVFDRSSKILSLGVSDPKGFRGYLNQNGGIRIFRDGIRVYDYGEPGNDWLKLDLKRVNQPGKTISNNIVIGAIYLDRKSSDDLEEKTNREGFIENEAYFDFVTAVRFVLDKVLTQRNLDKEKIRQFYGPKNLDQPVIGPLKELQEKIEKKIKNRDVRDSLLSTINDIEKDFVTITEIYTRSASAGLSLSIVIHEIIHMIEELSLAIKAKKVDEHVKKLVGALQKTTSNYAAVIRRSRKSKHSIPSIVNQALANIEFRIKAHQLKILKKTDGTNFHDEPISLAKNLTTSTIINLVDNSIWWMAYAEVENKKILFKIVEPREGFLGLLICDNGPGFSIPPNEAIKPFVSDRPEGMGLGLHLTHEVMKAQKGFLSFPSKYDYELPSEFKNGAKILLSFRRSK